MTAGQHARRAPQGLARSRKPSVQAPVPANRRAGTPTAATALPASTHAAPLADVLLAAAHQVRAVLDGHSLAGRMDEVPTPLRSAVQAISFYAMRHLGTARAAYRALVQRHRPEPLRDALILQALTLLDAAGAPPGSAAQARATPVYAAHTVVDQTVRAAAQHPRIQHHKGFVNAVLRNYLRQRDTLPSGLADNIEARWNFPAWWVARLQTDYPKHWQDILRSADTPAPMTLRVNCRRQTVSGLLARLREHGISARAVGDTGVMLDATHPVHILPGFARGWWSVQDAAAQRAAPLLGLRDGMRVLDACAAPGGKTAHCLELADVHVHALDVDAQRLPRVRQNLERLGLYDAQRVTLTRADAADTHDWWDGIPFDAVLVDAPCTASGVVRRHPDIRWLRREADLVRTVALQQAIACALWPVLRPGGRLLYATCSVFPAEGEQQAQAFLQRWSDARRLPAPGQLLPLTQGNTPAADGFFYALFGKQG